MSEMVWQINENDSAKTRFKRNFTIFVFRAKADTRGEIFS